MGLRRGLQLAVVRAVLWSLVPSSYLLLSTANNSTQETCQTTTDSDESSCSTHTTSTVHLEACGLWLAPSTLPGAGLGMFAGKDFAKKELLQETGDVVIPIVDILMHQRGRGKFTFLWDEYTWSGKSLGRCTTATTTN